MSLFLPINARKRKWVAVCTTLAICAALTAWGIYGIGEYGVAMFALTPLLLGFLPAVLYGYGRPVTPEECTKLGFLTLGLFTAGLLVFAMEGLICVAMAAPFGLVFTYLGVLFGYACVRRGAGQSLLTALLLIAAIPLLSAAEHRGVPEVEPVVTRVVINAPPEEVWKQVVEFPVLDEPTEWLFRLGIAYPINATIDGEGVGAVRHCNFNTGSFVEPITTWDAPRLLQFDVLEQPAPLREISFWDVDAPHLHDYFVSRRGQFRLIAQPDGSTVLEGTTWYSHNLKPAFYWRWWSDAIVHRIHLRVLNHIKAESERHPRPAALPLGNQ